MDTAGSVGASEVVTILVVALLVLAVKVVLLWLAFRVVRDAFRRVRRARRSSTTPPV